MKNWSGNVKWNPAEIAYPTSEEEVVALVEKARKTQRKIRMIGSGHSFVPLCATTHITLSLDKHQGIIDVDTKTNQVRVKAGTKLQALNKALDKHNLALENMGDIDVQSIAGAISTGTHGTGTDFGNVSTLVTAIRFVNGLGEIVDCTAKDENTDLFKAAQVSLGALGVITEVTLQCIPSYNLHIHINSNTIDYVLGHYKELNQKNRHFEYYWFPNTDYVMTKELVKTDQPAEKTTRKEYLQEVVLENYGFGALCELSYRLPSMSRKIAKFTGSLVSEFTKIKRSYEVFSTSRIVHFNEMEYNLPIEAYDEVVKELIAWNNKHNKNIIFPQEHRFVKGDDIMMSPAYQRDSAYIAVHAYHKKSYKDYFHNIEAIFKAHGGRPHWGKLHQRTASDFEALYPRFNEFITFREKHDPQDIFLSPYISRILYQ